MGFSNFRSLVKLVTGGKSRVTLYYAQKYWTLAQSCSEETDLKLISLESKYGEGVPLKKSAVVDSVKFRDLQTKGQVDTLHSCMQMHDIYLAELESGKPKKECTPCSGTGNICDELLFVPCC